MFKKIPKLLFIVVFCLLAVVLGLYAVASFFQAPAAQTTVSSQRFVIPKGQAIAVIAERLVEAGLIKNALAFRAVVYQQDLLNRIQAGSFELSPAMNVWQIAATLTVGTDDVWVTLPEGWRREEIAASLSEQGLPDFSAEEFLALTKGMEGQLFPDTYLVSRQISTSALITLLNNTFESKVKRGLATALGNHELSLNEILTLASLVQRESANDAEMPLVAQILLNRLAIGMPLQVDATLQYVKGYNQTEKSWWPTPLAVDKQLESPYNTYINAGLPPGPIANPGLAAIKAVLTPTPTDALYYIHDRQGQIHTATDLSGHNANVSRYLR